MAERVKQVGALYFNDPTGSKSMPFVNMDQDTLQSTLNALRPDSASKYSINDLLEAFPRPSQSVQDEREKKILEEWGKKPGLCREIMDEIPQEVDILEMFSKELAQRSIKDTAASYEFREKTESCQ